MRKWLIVVSLMLVGALFLTACTGGSEEQADGQSENDKEVIEVEMWNLFAAGDAQYMQNIVDKFNESQSEIFVNNVTQENAQYYTKLMTSVSSGKGPDLAISHMHVLPELVSQGLVTELNDLGKDVGIVWEDFNKNILDATIYDGVHYALPIDIHPQIMYINNELVDQAGLLNEDGTIKMDKSPEGYIEFFKTLKERLPEGTLPFASSSAGGNPYWLWWGFYTQLGGENIVSEDSLENPTYNIDLDKAIQAANFLKDLYHDEEIIRLNVSDYYPDFQAGNAATITAGVWATGTWEITEGLDITPMPIPNVFGEKGAWANSHTFVLPYYQDTDPEVQKAAIEFMDFATDNGAMWAQAGHIPAKKAVIESEEFNELPYRNQYAEVANYGNFADRNIYARGIEEILIGHLDTVWSGEVTAEEAFKKIETEVKELIGE
ncbi:extracellular solute-binding protein [Oceanobacillus damuensis]|uniref:extracellular solute-binding protein n=1 Tax=Oceanobacillus damuensis TaxID=937928 RepID=UPI0008379DE6|nr:extracellular solute-binding protein [Oceanobacillus damuensis]